MQKGSRAFIVARLLCDKFCEKKGVSFCDISFV